MKPHILLGLTGSVATTLAPKMVQALSEIGEVAVVMTKRAENFVRKSALRELVGKGLMRPNQRNVFTEEDEWAWYRGGHERILDEKEEVFSSLDDMWRKDDPVLHIELRKWADVLVIAPLSVDLLAKMANGICDSLLASVFRAWDLTKPIVLAPAANTMMWEHPLTEKHLEQIKYWFAPDSRYCNNCYIVPPIEKGLACGETGVGAMAMIDDVVDSVENSLNWIFPVEGCPGIPINYHPGAFGFHRRHSHHTGVDLYVKCFPNYNIASGVYTVFAVEGGTVVGYEKFTGPQDNSPWWNNTDAVLVEGKSGVVCYGEIGSHVSVGQKVKRGDVVGYIVPVLPEGKERPDIPGHSRAMLHFELYKQGVREASKSWKHDQPMHDYMTDPTPFLMDAIGAPTERLIWENPERFKEEHDGKDTVQAPQG
jgi:phosphopantothenoylcysteine decarboxylase